MTEYKHLPFELLDAVVSYLSDDTSSLRNVSQSSRALDAISKPHLFRVMEFRQLSRPSTLPFKHFVKELHLTWKMDMFDDREALVLERHLALLTPEIMPRLNSLVVFAVGPSGMEYLSSLGKALAPFVSLTSLTLIQTQHRNLRDLQALICTLPHLKDLRLKGVVWHQTVYEATRGPHLECLHVSETFPACSLRTAEWLAATPSAESLRTLVIPSKAHNAPAIVPLFGPSVHHLSVPLRRLTAFSLARFTALQSLILTLPKYHPRADRWTELPTILSSLPAPAVLRTLTFQLELDTLRSEAEIYEAVSSPTSAMQGADRVLSTADDHSGTPMRFSALCEVRVVLRTSFEVGKEKRGVIEGLVRGVLGETNVRGKLAICFESS